MAYFPDILSCLAVCISVFRKIDQKMKSVEFLIDSQHQAKKLVISTPKKGGQHGPVSSLATKFSSKTTYYRNVKEIYFTKICIVA